METIVVPPVTLIVPEVLREDNYEEWSDYVTNYLVAHDLWDIVADETNSEVDFEKLRKKNAAALHAIKISCSQDILKTLKNPSELKTAKSLWCSLKNTLQKPDTSPVNHLNDDLDNHAQWRVCVTNYLKAQDLWDIVDGTMKCDNEKFENKNATALHAIKSSCSPNILNSLKNPSDLKMARSLWNSLEIKISEKFHRFMPLVNAINKGDLKGVKDFINHDSDGRKEKILYSGFSAIHLATVAGHEEIVKELMEEELKDTDVLFITAMNGMTEIAEILLKKHKPELIMTQNNEGLIPVSIACNRGRKKAAHFLYFETTKHLKELEDSGPLADDILKLKLDNSFILLHAAISQKMFDIALDLVEDNKGAGLGTKRCEWSGRSGLYILSGMPSDFKSSTRFSRWERFIYECIPVSPPAFEYDSQMYKDPSQRMAEIIRFCLEFIGLRVELPDSSTARKYDPQMYKEPSQPMAGIIRFMELIGIKQIYEKKLVHGQTSQLLDYIFRETPTLDYEQREEITNSLFRAVKNGITEIVIQIIQAYPDMFWARTKKNGRDIFQYAIANRQEQVFSLLYGVDARKVPLITSKDINQNNMLHIAGSLAPPPQLAHISGAALQLQRELQWFEEVKGLMGIIDPVSIHKKNKNKETPAEVFTENHKDLVIQGEKWMKEYAASCTLVGTLIMTIMFAAAFTVPGGTDGDTGLPLFRQRTSFMVYIISDAVALFTSSTSVLTFLGMLTSRYSEQYFLKSLPGKLITGLVTLFCSITAMMVTFCAALIIMLKGELSVIVPIIALAGFTVIVFVYLQFPLLIEILCRTYRPIFTKKVKPWLCMSE